MTDVQVVFVNGTTYGGCNNQRLVLGFHAIFCFDGGPIEVDDTFEIPHAYTDDQMNQALEARVIQIGTDNGLTVAPSQIKHFRLVRGA